MRIPLKLLAAATGVALLLGLTGCDQPAPHVIPRSEPTATPVFATDADALAAAKAAYLAYLKVSDEIMADGGTDPQRLLSVATPAEVKLETNGYAQVRANKWRSTGQTRLSALSLQGYFPGHRVGIVSVYACLDVSHTDVLDSNGQSVVLASRAPFQAFQATFDLVKKHPVELRLAGEEPWTGGGICE